MSPRKPKTNIALKPESPFGAIEDRVRQCVACREFFPRSQLMRLIYSRIGSQPGSPFGMFSLDGDPPLQGRSAYCCQQEKCLNEAIRARKFQRTLKRGIPDDIVERLKARLKGLSSL
jgi:uncharacterized protein